MPEEQAHSGSNFALAFFFLSEEKCRALAAVYAFCRAVDDAVDEPSTASPRAELARWREKLERLYSGGTVPDGLPQGLERAVKTFGLKKEHFLLVIEGMERDAGPWRYATFAELEYYLYRAASAVGLLCMDIFGHKGAGAEEYAKWTGYAVQLTNIIRDIGEDAARGRVYIPAEDMARFGVAEADFSAREPSPALTRLLAFEAERAEECYAKAGKCLAPEDRKNLFPAEIMSCIYRRLLRKIEHKDFRVLDGRISLGTWQKLAAIFDAWRRL